MTTECSRPRKIGVGFPASRLLAAPARSSLGRPSRRTAFGTPVRSARSVTISSAPWTQTVAPEAPQWPVIRSQLPSSASLASGNCRPCTHNWKSAIFTTGGPSCLFETRSNAESPIYGCSVMALGLESGCSSVTADRVDDVRRCCRGCRCCNPRCSRTARARDSPRRAAHSGSWRFFSQRHARENRFAP
jgi:hypothetical protein